MSLNPAIQEYLDNVQQYLSSVGGRAFLSDIGQPTRVPRPQGLPGGVVLRDICQRDGRFMLYRDNSYKPPRLEISLTSVGRDRNAIFADGLVAVGAPPSTEEIITAFLTRVEDFVTREGGRVLFSSVGQIPRPEGITANISLRELCQNDERFTLLYDYAYRPPRVEILLNGGRQVPPPPLDRDAAIAEFLDNVERHVTQRGGRALFSEIGQVARVPRPPGFPVGVSLRDLCNQDPRFEIVYDRAFDPPRAEILLAPRVHVVSPVEEATAQYANQVAQYLEDNMERLTTVVEDNPVPELLVAAGRSARAILEEQPNRFRFRTARAAQDDYVFLIDPESESSQSRLDGKAAVASGEVVEDFGSPADLLPPLPSATSSWTPPEELQSVSVTSFRRNVEYTVYAPLELKNKDYVRRVLDITSEGISTSVAHIMDKNQQYDIYSMLRDIVTSSATFESAFGVHTAQFNQFLEAARNLLQARNMLMHMNFFGANNAASAARARELFMTAFQVLGAFDRYCQTSGRPNQPQDAIATLIRLRMQYDWHLEWNAARYGTGADQSSDGGDDFDEDMDPEEEEGPETAVDIADAFELVAIQDEDDDDDIANANE